ncbi:MAG: DUF1549 domain-containing protein, partial [Planctomycetota bacterium]|nr:DUF1549 domain-containing protein [Planctomycetota bacterium]
MSAAALALVTCLVAQPTGEDLAGIEFFEKRIRPLLVESCYRCHSRTAKRLRGGLLVDSRAGLLEGGDSGPAIVPGKPEESRLIRAVSYEDEDLQMPPKGKLPKGAIADLVAWVRRGGPYPRVDASRGRVEKSPPADLEKARRFWAFRPVVEPPLPPVEDADWCRSPLDRFVLSGLDEAGLRPAPPATRRAFVRRATFDLTGLPPAPEEVGVFLTDESPDAYERLVDRLLASPRHGERWGRHWLDVARYADSNGVDENMAYANAYRYRDYVIDSFNRDKPFDRLIHEQIAGDLLPGRPGEDPNERIERLIATGFLSLGPKMIACDDGRKMELDIVDEQLDTVCRAFLGITMGCARCHDHKFDPFSTADYYGLAGIFKSTKTMENFKVVAVWHEHEIATPEERQAFETHEEKIRDVDRRRQESERVAREEFLARERKKAGRYFGAAAGLVGLGPLVADGSYALGGLASPKDLRERAILREAEAFDRGDLTVDTTNWGPGIGVLLHEGHAEYDLELPRGGRYQLELRYAAQESRPVRIIVNGDVVKDDGARDVTGGWHAKHQRWHVEGAFDFRRGRNVVRLERRSGPVPHIDKLLLVPVEPGAGRAGSSAGGA